MQRYQQTRHALGSTAYVTVVLENDRKPTSVFSVLWQEIEAFEQRFSRFQPESELSKFNAAVGIRQPVSKPFRALLIAAKDAAEKSGGLYNPSILPALQRAGYKGSWPEPHKANSELLYEDRKLSDWRDITIGDTWAKIPANAALDFGGIGKGYLLDKLAETLHAIDVPNYWLSLGGDILCNGYDGTGDSWQIDIQNARTEGTLVASVKNNGSKLAVATSGITKRQGVSGAGSWHHIIDPRTGEPASTDTLTASVCATSATDADIAAKCLVIAASTAAESTLLTVGLADALLQTKDSSIIKIGTTWVA